MEASTQLTRNRWYRLLLQASWARGKDLARIAGGGWEHRPTPASVWNGEQCWRTLQALPQRSNWFYQDDVRSIYDMLDEIQVVVPGLDDRYYRTWLGAEAGVRALLPSEVLVSEQQSYFLHAADWVTTVHRSQANSEIPTYAQSTPLEMLPLHSWIREPFSETCGGLRRAVICGLLWPGNTQRAKAATFFDASNYTGAAQTAQAWLAIAAALMITDSDPNLVDVLRVGLRQLPHHSHIRAIGEWTYAEFTAGTSWVDWLQQLSCRCYYYPADHVVPNVAWILGGLLWGGAEWHRVLPLTTQAGFDPTTRALVTGALFGLTRSWIPALPDRVTRRLAHQAVKTLASARLHTVIR